jgi:putative membrane protein
VTYLQWFFRLLVLVVLMGFALKNTDPVAVRFYLGSEWHAPLVFVLLVAFVCGAAAGLFASLGAIVRKRREIAALRKQLRNHGPGQAQ